MTNGYNVGFPYAQIGHMCVYTHEMASCHMEWKTVTKACMCVNFWMLIHVCEFLDAHKYVCA